MTQAQLYVAGGLLVAVVGLWGLLTQPHLLKKVLALNVMGSGVCLVLVGIARRGPERFADPVPHALVLTGVVVAVSATALGIALTRRIHAETGATRLDDDAEATP